MPRQRVSTTAMQRYLVHLRGYVRAAAKLARELVLPEVELAWREQWGGDADRLDADDRDVARALEKARAALDASYPDEQLLVWANEAGQTTSRVQGQSLNRQTKVLIGVQPLADSPAVSLALDTFRRGNVGLIKTIPDRFFSEIGAAAQDVLEHGTRPEVFAEALQERTRVSASRARVIARDQVSKLHGQLNEIRQQDLGITHYIWRSSHDSRVRESCEANDGQRFAWADPPPDGHPGEPIQGRCTAEPVLPDQMATAAAA